MSKIVLNDVTNLSSLSVINSNFDKIEQEFQNKAMYRDNPEGEPNTFETDVDLNGHNVYNVENLTVAGSFTVNGKDIEVVVDDAIAGITQSAESAANSATSAAASAVSSASSAATSTAQAAIATTKASEASASATSASSSATAAASSATSAASSATSATASAATATTQAGIATTQATNSSNSAAASAASASTATTQAGISTTQANNSASSATASAASAAAAASSLDNFDDRYLGSKASGPSLDNDGDALLAGALYFNNGTVVADDKGMWIYDGSIWIKASSASQAILTTYEYIATGGQSTFTGLDLNSVTLVYTVGSVVVTLNGVKLRGGVDYTASTGSSVVLAAAAASGDELVIDAFSTFDIADTYTQGEVDGFAVKLTGNQTIAGTKTFSSPPVMGVTGLSGDIAADRIKAALNAVNGAPIYACRAWVNFNGTGTVAIRASGNVSSITDNGVGLYTVNFTTAMSDADYVAVLTGTGNTAGIDARQIIVINGSQGGGASIKSTTQLQILCGVTSSAVINDVAQINVAIFR